MNKEKMACGFTLKGGWEVSGKLATNKNAIDIYRELRMC